MMPPGWHARHTHTVYSTQYILGYYGEVRHVRNASAKAKAEPGADEGPGADYVSSIHVNVPDSSEPDSGGQGVEAIGSGH